MVGNGEGARDEAEAPGSGRASASASAARMLGANMPAPISPTITASGTIQGGAHGIGELVTGFTTTGHRLPAYSRR